MSPSPMPGGSSSAIHGTAAQRSRFTYRHLSQLASYQTTNPLRVIAHIDLDAFYAQCEMVRLGVPEDKPLAVQQWYAMQGLIAINYPAREAGIGRHCNVTEAKKLCPSLIAQHVATWREGDDKWAYRDDAAANIAKDKVSLDPYRLQSRKILSLIKETLPPGLQRVEKASIDEVYLDLSAQVHSTLIERFPELASPPPYDDSTEALPLPPTSALDWQADALVDLDEEGESADPDWDDVAILVGSEVVREIRQRIRRDLGYTCSAGIANNKLLSKLGSAFKKPNRQTVIRNRAVAMFLGDFRITKMRNLGGKLGEQVVSIFGTDAVKNLLDVPLEQMKQKLGDETGLWVYNTVRGIDTSEVNSRTQIKSMLSAKSFRPFIQTSEQAFKWLKIFAADIYARLVEEGVLENKRRPRTITLHHRHSSQTHSRQAPIPLGQKLSQEILFNLAVELLRQIMAHGSVWPCANLSLSVGGFEDGIKGNMGISSFLVKGEDAEALRYTTPEPRRGSTEPDQTSRKRRADDGGIKRFFSKRSFTDDSRAWESGDRDRSGSPIQVGDEHSCCRDPWQSVLENHGVGLSSTSLVCSRCNCCFATSQDLQSHEDWHMAKDLQDKERGTPAFAERTVAPRTLNPKERSAGSSRRGRGGKAERGQSKLKFA
ncbi:N-acetyltransferase-like protein [Hapsidospora chrysogenum ATCC 11550]|uniref:DNA polymerase eta n=1 Tax=Hapsidospora chrysogenum (strain ATCC 11550 / CBS 779.69 / DSM 880 / IAM 14645 / JCM 23072 / IMI 49137) TaxID=857340 RepID=A0A086TCD6_HAPC1|nr:N-acetyltransferase-like protein [Hapsidospora chrysogenum ATCC 11550]